MDPTHISSGPKKPGAWSEPLEGTANMATTPKAQAVSQAVQ